MLIQEETVPEYSVHCNGCGREVKVRIIGKVPDPPIYCEDCMISTEDRARRLGEEHAENGMDADTSRLPATLREAYYDAFHLKRHKMSRNTRQRERLSR